MNDDEIAYPVFLRCIEHCVDKFWEKIFKDLAYGKSPYSIYFHNGYLCHGKSKKCKYIDISDDTTPSYVLYKNVYKLLNENAGITSPNERLYRKHHFNSNIINNSFDWSDIKKKTTKDILIELFALEMKNKYKLTIMQCRFLISIISGLLTFKTITSDDIEMKDGVIFKIEGIEFSESNVEYNLDIYNLDNDNLNKPLEDKTKKNMINHWFKFLYELEKKNDF